MQRTDALPKQLGAAGLHGRSPVRAYDKSLRDRQFAISYDRYKTETILEPGI